MLRNATVLATLAALTLAGCSTRQPVLPGERLNVRDVLQTRGGGEDAVETQNTSRPAALAPQVSNAEWTQSPVSPFVRVDHAALSGAPQPLWSAPIGAGDSKRKRLNTDPVVAGGRIYTMDADHVVRATARNGEPVWTRSLVPLRDEARQAQGGGLAHGEGRLYAASGFGTLTALDPATGAEIWTQKLGNTATGAPSVRDGVVYVVSGDRTAWAIEADTGRVRWQIEGAADTNNVAGGPAPAIGEDHVFFSFGTATVQAAFRQGGLKTWNADILGRRNGFALSVVDDLTGDPLIAGDTLYVGNHSGRVVAFASYDGERKWTAREGALGPLWPTGDSVYFVSDRNQLIRLDAATGARIWAVDLPGYEPSRRPHRRRDAAYANLGPVLAGGRLIVASSDGQIRSFSPEDGSLLGSVAIEGGATTRPVVAGGTLYVVSTRGVLHAYR
ncbi:outer membrane protein assembly factor BamB family protein [Pseudoponticoccus marisrubri]|uniref:Quinoprotein n=1 Tax=Pseudoponticoccus marisrubri TaxID=1685382 RepID=A0A0W7WLN7_9RHOB|nr:PQQ-like beta-propeller repeat protein [Pseudoponticoccus marisrubri]KUF11482.1 quinoprotein [Pseudoponticoccus marisrubri]